MLPTTATLKNGSVATLRPLRADDRERMAAAIRGLDAQTIYTRLFSHRKELTEAGLNRAMPVEVARVRGIAVFEADVLSENRSMLRVFERMSLPMRKRSEAGAVHVELTLQQQA